MPKGIFHFFTGGFGGLLSSFFRVLIAIFLVATISAKELVLEFAEAIKKEDIKKVRRMLADGFDPNTRIPKSHLNYTPLFLAVETSKPSITEALLKAGANPALEDENGDPVMVYAADVGREKHARLLIQHGQSIDSKNSAGVSALLRGASYENGPDLQVKIDLGANLNLTDPEGNTALIRASQAGNVEAMKVLIKAGAKLDIFNEAGEGPLILALGRDSYGDDTAKHAAAVKLLIEAGVDINHRHPNGKSALLIALDSWNVSQKTIEALLAAKPEVSIRDENGRDALFHAVLDKDDKAHITPLIELGADPKTTDKEGTNLLMLAARNNQSDLVREFISRDLSAKAKNKSGETAVHFAARAKGAEIIEVLKLLHKNGALLTAPDMAGNTPLHLAAASKTHAIFSYLLPHYPDVNIANAQGETPLHLAALNGNGLIIEQLIPRSEDIDQRDSRGFTALMNSIAVDHRWAFQRFVKAGADIDATNLKGISSLSAAISANEFDKARFLLKNGANPKTVKDPNTELLRVARLFHDQIISPKNYALATHLLAQLSIDINHRDAEGRTALMWAAASGNKAALQTILDRKPLIDARSRDGRTALMWAACSRATNSMKTLEVAGADVSLKDPSGRTAKEWLARIEAAHQSADPQIKGGVALRDRIIRSRKTALQKYLEKGTWKKGDQVAGIPPLCLAAGLGDVGSIKTLIRLGAPEPKDWEGKYGTTPLMEAAVNGQLEAVEFLLQLGADPTLRDHEWKRAVDYAVELGHANVARIFITRKIAFSEDETDLLTALVHCGDELLLREFLRAGVAIGHPKSRSGTQNDPFASGARASNPASVLIAAVRKPDARILRVLMEFPKASGVADSGYLISALHHAAYQGRLENVKVLIEKLKVDPDPLLADSFGGVIAFNSRDPDGNGPRALEKFSALSRALEEGHLQIVRYLVQQGATITGRTRKGAPPLTYAIDHRQDEMLRFFLKNEPPLELVNLNGQTALHRAAVTNHKLAVDLLLKNGADAKAKTPEGLTPLALARKNKAKGSIDLLEATSK